MGRRPILVVGLCLASALIVGLLAGCERLPVEGSAPSAVNAVRDRTAPSEPEAMSAASDEDERNALRKALAERPSRFVMRATAEDRSTGEKITSSAAVETDDGRLLKVRVQMDTGEVLLDYEAGLTYAWNAGSNVATKLQTPAAGGDLADFSMALDPGAEVLRRETLSGIHCWVVRGGDDEATLWVSRESGLTRRMETEDAVVRYSYGPVDPSDRLFELPEGMTVREAPIG